MISRMIAAAALLAAAVPMPLAAERGPKVGAPAPDFTLTLIDGTRIRRDDLRGKVVVLNFWATWCVPCRGELPLLDAYYDMRKDAGLRVFAVATEDSVPLYRMKQLFAVLHLSPAKRLKGPYEAMKGVPTNIIIGRDGRIRYAQAGAFTLESLNTLLVPLLNEAPPS